MKFFYILFVGAFGLVNKISVATLQPPTGTYPGICNSALQWQASPKSFISSGKTTFNFNKWGKIMVNIFISSNSFVNG